ncbi:hypothetical protein [Arthrobacter sp. U41]|uniref:hypothetical protein n=1 Tax=Arthrobacter sp. U41 TaxID=1849032 RepID=UPI000859307A|nr:hypothetical protein [Arthrobacter sp. U41]AOT03281.1 hypothetical protein ASPU41_07960 [Arthrobacter sp. U41]
MDSKLSTMNQRTSTVNDYSEDMKSEDASPILRKLTEEVALEYQHPQAAPRERLYEDFALLIRRPRDGWAVGLRVDFTTESWSIAEVVAFPAGQVQSLPQVDTEDVHSYVEESVNRARGRRRVAEKQLAKLATNTAFIEQRFETWRDKAAPRTNVEYAALAAKYAEQIRLGNSRATATLAELVDMSPSVMAQRIKEARRRALLTPGEQGRASGALTPLGVLYTDPQFPGMRSLRLAGMTQRGIADKYGIEERLVWAALMGEGYSDGEGLILSADVLPSKQGIPLTAEDIMRNIHRTR